MSQTKKPQLSQLSLVQDGEDPATSFFAPKWFDTEEGKKRNTINPWTLNPSFTGPGGRGPDNPCQRRYDHNSGRWVEYDAATTTWWRDPATDEVFVQLIL